MILDLEFSITEVIFILVIFFFLCLSILLISLINQQKERNRLLSAFAQFYAKNEMLKGVAGGYLNAEQCPRCNNIFVAELFTHQNECPFCGLSFRKGNIIFEHKGKIKSTKRKVFESLSKKSQVALIREL